MYCCRVTSSFQEPGVQCCQLSQHARCALVDYFTSDSDLSQTIMIILHDARFVVTIVQAADISSTSPLPMRLGLNTTNDVLSAAMEWRVAQWLKWQKTVFFWKCRFLTVENICVFHTPVCRKSTKSASPFLHFHHMFAEYIERVKLLCVLCYNDMCSIFNCVIEQINEWMNEWMRSLILSHCRDLRMCVIWENLGAP